MKKLQNLGGGARAPGAPRLDPPLNIVRIIDSHLLHLVSFIKDAVSVLQMQNKSKTAVLINSSIFSINEYHPLSTSNAQISTPFSLYMLIGYLMAVFANSGPLSEQIHRKMASCVDSGRYSLLEKTHEFIKTADLLVFCISKTIKK